MKFFPRIKDDFAAIAASPERRRAEIVNLDHRAKRIGLNQSAPSDDTHWRPRPERRLETKPPPSGGLIRPRSSTESFAGCTLHYEDNNRHWFTRHIHLPHRLLGWRRRVREREAARPDEGGGGHRFARLQVRAHHEIRHPVLRPAADPG